MSDREHLIRQLQDEIQRCENAKLDSSKEYDEQRITLNALNSRLLGYNQRISDAKQKLSELQAEASVSLPESPVAQTINLPLGDDSSTKFFVPKTRLEKLNGILTKPVVYIILVPLIIGIVLVLLQVALQSPTPPATLETWVPSSTPTDTSSEIANISESTENAVIPEIIMPRADTFTATDVPPSETPTRTFTPSEIPTDTLTPSETPTDTPTATNTSTSTPTSTATATPTLTFTPTQPSTLMLEPLSIATQIAESYSLPLIQNFPIEGTQHTVGMVFVPGYCDIYSQFAECIADATLWVDQYEVSNERYRLCNTCSLPNDRRYYDDPNFDQYPVVFVTWQMATEYCRWRGAELPTETIWRYTASSILNYSYPWGNSFNPANVVDVSDARTFPVAVGNRQNSASWVGTEDMSGNVAEWVVTAALNNDNNQVVMGGSWRDGETSLRTDSFIEWPKTYFADYIGFRCALFVD